MVRLGPHGCGDSGEAASGVGGGLLGSNGGLWLGLEASVVAERARLSVLPDTLPRPLILRPDSVS